MVTQPHDRPIHTALAVAMLIAVAATPAYAKVIRNNQGWYQIIATGPLAGRLRLYLEAQPRTGITSDTDKYGTQAFLARGAFGWKVRPGWSLWAGYGFTPTFHPTRDEHRAYQESFAETKVGPFEMLNRTRFEQRFFQGTSTVSLRARHFLRFAYPLPRWPAWSLVASDEFFFNLNTVPTAPVSGFDQNRAMAGISRQVTPQLRVEIDYLNQIVNGRRGSQNTLRHSGFLQLLYKW